MELLHLVLEEEHEIEEYHDAENKQKGLAFSFY